MSTSCTEYVACHECDLLHRVADIGLRERAKCGRCGATLLRSTPEGAERALLLAVSAFILFAIAVSYPLLTFKLQGHEQHSSILTGIFTLEERGFWELAILVFLCSILLPAVRILTGIYLFLPMHFGRRPPGFTRVFPLFQQLGPWAMTEVYLLGLIVAYVKLTDLATIVVGVASYAFMGLILVTAWLASSIDSHAIWHRVMAMPVRPSRTSGALPPNSAQAAAGRSTVNGALVGQAQGETQRFSCPRCSLNIMGPDTSHDPHVVLRCPRCQCVLHHRKPNSISRAWAFLIAAAICYIPANVLPIMTVTSFGSGSPSTILSGVGELIEVEMYPIAILVFVASIFVPVLKILVLSYLLLSVQRGSKKQPRERTLLYRATETIGRWSMLDIFMISILAGLVQLQALATIAPEPGAVFFAAVVILTMFAAAAFDSRLIWDRANGRQT
jgi:paraquat-inducible protein A